jgi:predicted DNA-binding mobile mystery protein A
MSLQKLYFQQISSRLEDLRNTKLIAVAPSNGWIKSIRTALEIPLSEMARRLGVNSTTVLAAERNEVANTITLAQLKRMADVLDCDLVYALIPRKSLSEIVNEEATKVATQEMATVAHSMALENQEPSHEFIVKKIRERKEELIAGSWKKIWSSR